MNAAQLEPAAVAPEAARPGWHGPQQYSAERAARQEFCRRIERGELTEVERRTLANLVYAVGYMVETPLRDDRLIECTARWTVTHEQYRALLPADGAL